MVSTTEEVQQPVEVQQPAEIRNITEEEFEKAQKLFQQGKKNLFLNKYDESVNNFADACKSYAAKFGEMDPQCAEVYFFYGRALLELARIENNVLGNALTGVPEETEPIDDSRYGNPEDVAAEEKEEIAEKVIDAMCTTEEELRAAETAAANGEEVTPAATTTETPVATEVVAEATPTAAATATTEAAAATTTETPAAAAAAEGEAAVEGEEEEEEECDEGEETAEDENKEEESEDIGNLQSSWEMFELAKVIYTKNFNDDLLFRNKRVAECLLKLGEISIEQEIYEQAVTDIAESIRVQEEIALADRDERMLAESYYQLGLARQFNNLWTDANEAYQRSINIVQLRIEKLRGRLTTIGEGADADLERTTVNDEITELEALLPEMTSKLEEVNEQGQQTLNLIREAKECFTSNVLNGAAAAVTTAAATGDVKDITSMVKSKRKIDSVDEAGSMKKTRLSSESGEQQETSEAAAIEVDENKENQVEEAARMEEAVVVTKEPVAAEEPVANVEATA